MSLRTAGSVGNVSAKVTASQKLWIKGTPEGEPEGGYETNQRLDLNSSCNPIIKLLRSINISYTIL